MISPSLTSTQQIYLTFVLLAVCCQPVRWFMKNCHMKQSVHMEIIPRCNEITTSHHVEMRNLSLCQGFSLLFQDSILLSQLNTKIQLEGFPSDKNKLLIPVLLTGEKMKLL